MSIKIWSFTIIICLVITRISLVPTLTGYYAYLKDNTHAAIDICSQGGDYTFIIGSDFKIYKWNYATSQFDFFQGPTYFVNPDTFDYEVRSITCTETGDLYCCRNHATPMIFKYSAGAWTTMNATNVSYCYHLKIGNGPGSRLYVGREGVLNNNVFYLNNAGSFVSYGITNNFAFSSDDIGI